MKKVFFTWLILIASSAYANNCPDLQGKYSYGHGAVEIVITQAKNTNGMNVYTVKSYSTASQNSLISDYAIITDGQPQNVGNSEVAGQGTQVGQCLANATVSLVEMASFMPNVETEHRYSLDGNKNLVVQEGVHMKNQPLTNPAQVCPRIP